MAFDNLDYSTEWTDEESLQDTIDKSPVLNAIRSDISKLEKEVFWNISKVRVDIFERWSHLKVREKDGTIMQDQQALDGEILKVVNTNGNDHIIGPNQKLFVHVQLPNGRLWYVSADYVKVDHTIPTPTPRPSTNTQSIPIPKVKPKRVIPSDQNVTPEANPKPKKPNNNPAKKTTVPNNPANKKPNQNTRPRKDIEKKEVPADTPSYIIKDGTIWIAHEDSEDKIYEIDVIKNVEEAYPGISEYVSIWTTKAQSYVDGMMFKQWRESDEEIKASITQIKSLLNELQIIINLPNSKTQKEHKLIEDIFAEMVTGNTIMPNSDSVKKLILNNDRNLSQEEKYIKIYQLSRKGWSQDGDSSLINDFAINKLMQKPDYNGIINMLSTENSLSLIKNQDVNWVDKLIVDNFPGVFEREEKSELIQTLFTSYNKIRGDMTKDENIQQMKSYLPAFNEKMKAAWKDEIKLTDLMEYYEEQSLQSFIKHTLSYEITANMSNRWGPESLTGLYADMSGLGETSMWDAFNIADSNISMAKELWFIAVTSLLPLWAGAIAASLALRWGTAIARGVGLGRVVDSTWKAARASRFAAWSLTGWVAFYETSLIAQNAMRKNPQETEEFFKGWDDTKEISKSVAFFGALRALGSIRWIPKIKNITQKMPDGILKSGLTLSWEAAALMGVSQWVEYTFWDSEEGFLDSLSVEEFIQALIMTAALRWAGVIGGKVKISRDKNKVLQITDQRPAQKLITDQRPA